MFAATKQSPFFLNKSSIGHSGGQKKASLMQTFDHHHHAMLCYIMQSFPYKGPHKDNDKGWAPADIVSVWALPVGHALPACNLRHLRP